MKIIETWLREWVNPSIDLKALCQRLTMAGLEVEEIIPVELGGQRDNLIEIAVTPNRGDCLSVHGIAREVAALTQAKIHPIISPTVKATSDAMLPLKVHEPAACPHYRGRIIEKVRADSPTPPWLKDRLTHAGLKSINAIVDVTNYVMLELGQPMHAFDLAKINKSIVVRHAYEGEKITLLDGNEKKLDAQTLVIADETQPLALAGVMGGLDSSVTLGTTSIFLESAYFSAPIIARQRQHYNLSSDSAYRFERGVDPNLQALALERATQLIHEIAGGNPGPVVDNVEKAYLPKQKTIHLPQKKIEQILGYALSQQTIIAIFDALHFTYQQKKDEWIIEPPLYRFDMLLPEDVIEELARMNGYDAIPSHVPKVMLQSKNNPDSMVIEDKLRQTLQDQGFHEIISYSFIDATLQQAFDPDHLPCELINPITHEMKVMRTSLWPNLIHTMLYNLSRQQERIRLFELGICFVSNPVTGVIEEKPRLGGLIAGLAMPLQWGILKREADFFDLKGHLETLLGILKLDCDFEVLAHPVLHPGQSCLLHTSSGELGWMGAVHPLLIQQWELPKNTFLFELDLNLLRLNSLYNTHEISKFPEIRRDISILIDRAIPSKAISDTIKSVAGDWLRRVFIFDLYQGKGMAPSQKSIALALILQHPTRTLVDEEVVALIEKVVAALKGTYGAELRS